LHAGASSNAELRVDYETHPTLTHTGPWDGTDAHRELNNGLSLVPTGAELAKASGSDLTPPSPVFSREEPDDCPDCEGEEDQNDSSANTTCPGEGYNKH
jgi:hypothetical protein